MIKLFGSSQILKHDETITIFRTMSTFYVDGKPVKSEPVKYSFLANIQPLNGRQLLLVPEHDRFKEQYYLFANNYQTVDNHGLDIEVELPIIRNNDRVLRLNANFQVQETENWGSFVKARIVRLDIGVNATP